MAFETGTWLTPSDGLDKIRVFLLAQGWSVDAWFTEAPGKRLHMHKGAFYLNAKSADTAATGLWASTYQPTPQIGLNVGTGYNPALIWRDQAGVAKDASNVPIGAAMQVPPGPIVRYRFDYDDAYKALIIYVETATGCWRWCGFGESLITAGVITGGAWIAASAAYYYVGDTAHLGHNNLLTAYPFGTNSDKTQYPLVYVRADVDTFTGKWIGCYPINHTGKIGGTNIAGSQAVQTTIPSLTSLMNRARNSLNSLSALLPIQLFAARDAGGMSLLGTLPNVYATNISGMMPGQSYQQGVDWFTPFPGDVATRGTVVKRV